MEMESGQFVSSAPFTFAGLSLVQDLNPVTVVCPVVDVSMKQDGMSEEQHVLKKKRVESSSVAVPSVSSVKLAEGAPCRLLTVDRPPRASSASPVGSHSDSPIQRNGLRASVGSFPRNRTHSPSDKRLSKNFYKDALLRDSHNARTTFLSGAWLRNTLTTNQTATKGNSGAKAQGQTTGKATGGKRKMTSEAMDTS